MTTIAGMNKTRGWVSKLAAALGLGMALSSAQAAEPPLHDIVLVHGAFADGSSWQLVIQRLQALGYHVTAVQNGLRSLAEDVKATEQIIQRQPGKVLLVGHSWGGAVISQAGNADKVAGLAYLSALAPDSGESVAVLLQRLHAPMQGLTPDHDGLIWLDQPNSYQQVMANDLPMAQVQQLASVQQPIATTCFNTPIDHAAWRSKPSWYLQTTNDHALPPAVQSAIAHQIGATVQALHSSHMAMVSHPTEVAAWIDAAARASGQIQTKN